MRLRDQAHIMMKVSGVNRFAILSFLSVVALALSMGIALSSLLTRAVSEWEWENTAALARREVEVSGLEPLFTTPQTPETQERWKSALSGLLGGMPEVVRVKAWDRAAMVLWADDERLVGQRFPDNEELREALQGKVAVEIKEPGKAEQAYEQGSFTTLAEVYVPILSKANGEILGVLEIYKTPRRLSATIRWGTSIIWAISLAGALALYLVLLPLVRQVYGRDVRESTLRAYAGKLEGAVKERTRALESQTERLTMLTTLTQTVTASLDTQHVFEAVVQGTLQLFQVANVRLWVVDQSTGDAVLSATASIPDLPKEVLHLPARLPKGHWNVGWVIEHQQPLYTADLAESPQPHVAGLVKQMGFVSQLAVPLSRGDQALGALILNTRERREFSAEERELLGSFAAAAALAIEKARLYQETQQRRREAEELARVARSLTESLDMTAVGERIVTSVLTLFGVKASMLRLLQPDGALRILASSGEVISQGSGGHVLPTGMGLAGMAVAEGRPIWSADVSNEREIPFTAEMRDHHLRSGNRSMIAVPLRAHEQIIGSLGLSDRTGRIYSDSEVALLQTFADQAALALENARLFEEAQRRAAEVATLHEIGTKLVSTLDLSAVLEEIAGSAIQLIGAQRCAVFELDPRDQHLHARASKGMRPDQPFMPMKLGQGAAGSAALNRHPVFSPDIDAQPLPMYDEVWEEAGTTLREVVRRRGYRAILAVPLVSRETALGAICIYWDEIHAYDEREAQLLTALAQQAAVAIENARLYEETELRRCQAEELAQVARTLTESLDVKAVAERIVEGLRKLLKVMEGTVFRLRADGSLVAVALGGCENDSREVGFFLPPGVGVAGRAVTRGEPVCCADILHDSEIIQTEIHHDLAASGVRALLSVPLRSKGQIVGALGVGDQVGRVYTEADISLLQTFADQAALAIENAGLYEETERRRREAEELAQVARVLNERLGVQAVGERIVEGVRRLLKVVVGTVCRLRADGSLVVVAVSGPEGYEQEVGYVLPPGAGVTGRAVMRGEPVCCADILNDSEIIQSEIHDYLASSGVRALLALPLRSKDQIIGALAVGDQAGRVYTEADISLLQAFADQAALAMENARLFEEAQQRAGEVSTLHEIGTKLVSTLDLSAVLEEIAGSAIQLIGAQRCAVFELDPRDQRLRARASKGMRPDQPFIPMKLGQGAAGSAALERRPVFSPDIHAQPLPMYDEVWDEAGTTLREVVRRRGYRAILAVPLVSRETALGAICIYWDEIHAYDEREAQLLTALAQQAAVAMENARLYEETERRRREAEELAQVARMLTESLGVRAVSERIAEGVRRLSRVVEASVFRLQADGSLVVVVVSGREGEKREIGLVIPPGVGVAGRAVVTGEPVCCPDLLSDTETILHQDLHRLAASGVRAILAVPLRSKGRIIGALGVGDQAGRVYTVADISLLQTFADQAALALENARLYEETQERLTQTETLLAVGQAVGSTLDLAEVARRATREIVRTLGADIGGAWRFNSTRDALIPLAGYHVPKELMEAFASTAVSFDHPLVEEAARLKGPIYSSDSQSDSKFFNHPLSRLIPHKSLLIFPLLLKGEAMGGLAIAWTREAHRFTSEELRLVEGIAHQAAIAIENGWLYEQAQKTTRELHGLIRAGRAVSSSIEIKEVLETIAREAASVMRVGFCSLRLLHPDGDRLVWAAGVGFPPEIQDDAYLTKSLPGWVAAHGEPLAVLNRSTDDRGQRPPSWEKLGLTSSLGVPVKEGDRTIGVLSLLTKEPHAFSDEEIALALSFADQAAIAIKNARLFETERETKERLTASEQRYRDLFENAFDIVYLHDLDGKILAINEAGVRASGYPRAALLQMNLRELMVPEEPDGLSEMIRRMTAGDTSSELFTAELAGKDGQRMLLECSVRLISKDGAPVAVQGAARDITLRRKLEARQAAFVEIVKELSEEGNFDRIFSLIGRRTCELLSADAAVISLVEEDEIVFKGSYGLDEPERITKRRKLSSSRVRRVIETRRPHASGNMAHDPHWRGSTLTRLGYRAVLEVPIILRERVIGVLGVLHKSPRNFSTEDVNLLLSLAGHTAVALDRTNLLRELGNRLEETQTLLSVSQALSSTLDLAETMRRVARETARALRADMVGAYLADPDGESLHPIAGYHVPGELLEAFRTRPIPLKGHRFFEEARDHQRPVFASDVEHDPRIDRETIERLPHRSSLFVPMIIKDEIIGGFCVIWWERKEQLSQEDLRLVEGISRQAAMALTNSRLFEETQARLARMKRLAELSHLVSSTLDLSKVLDFITEAALELLNGDVSRIWVVDEEAKLLRLVAFKDRDGALPPPLNKRELPLGHGLVGWVVEQKAKCYSPNLQEDPLQVNKEWVRARGYTSQIAVPLVVGERALGALMLLTKTQRLFSQEEEELLEIFAAKAATAIENARLYERNQKMVEQLRLFAQAVRSIGEAVVITDLDERIIFVNEAFTKMRGYTEEEVLGQSAIHELAPRSPADPARNKLPPGIRQGGWQGELKARRKSGEEFPILLTTTPVLNDAGEPVAYVGVSRDLTEEKQLQAQLVQAEKLATIGQLAAGVAHEINNPLSVMLGFSDLALKKNPPPDLADDLDTIRAQSLRAAKIVRDLLAFARPAPHERVPVDLNELLRQTLGLQAYHLASDQIEVVWGLAEPLPETLADRGQIQQVILNLILNAHQAMKAAHDRGTLRIETGSDADTVWVKVTDDGSGITPELLPKIFDPFLTTKPVGQGTGLGLSVSYGIIQAHGGELLVESEASHGATFTVVLPVLKSVAETAAALPGPTPTSGLPLSVLVVDDEPAVARVVAQMFERLGHKAAVAHGGEEALAKLRVGSYDMMTLDLKMPRMSGQEVWERLQSSNLSERLTVLFVTGVLATDEAKAFVAESGQPYLEKPFQLDTLAQKLGELQLARAESRQETLPPR